MKDKELCIPYEVGDKIVIIANVVDKEKSFDTLGKLIYNKLDLKEYGLEFDSVTFDKDRYIDRVHSDLREEIEKELAKAIRNIDKLLMLKSKL